MAATSPGLTNGVPSLQCGLEQLAFLDRPTRQVIRRYERKVAAELVHVHVKKLAWSRPGEGTGSTEGRWFPTPQAGTMTTYTGP